MYGPYFQVSIKMHMKISVTYDFRLREPGFTRYFKCWRRVWNACIYVHKNKIRNTINKAVISKSS